MSEERRLGWRWFLAATMKYWPIPVRLFGLAALDLLAFGLLAIGGFEFVIGCLRARPRR